MGRICGIDLGTTNSLIGHGDELYTGLVSSSVNVRDKVQVDRDVISDDVVSSYKVNINNLLKSSTILYSYPELTE